jgi:hypothetical protein
MAQLYKYKNWSHNYFVFLCCHKTDKMCQPKDSNYI